MRIVLVAGGTGGHIYPGMAIAEEIQRRFPQAEILFLGSEEGLERDLIPRAGFNIKLIKARALLRKISYKALSAPFVSAFGFFQALRILSGFRPQALVSTGGYASLAAVLAAKLLGIPVFIHEQNVLPGVTNRLCFKLADEIFLSFEKSLAYHRGIVVGNPVRREIREADRERARKELGVPTGKKVMLIMGGSQGARKINETVLASLSKIDGNKWEILHVIGTRDFGSLPRPQFLFYHPFSYLYNIAGAMAAADLAVSRAGATAIAEFSIRGLPMILVPFPYSAEGHQELNAQAVAENGAGVVIKNEDFTPERFIAGLDLNLNEMGRAAKKMSRPDAAKMMVERIL
jgi:UDP-N-acetylglucosamine--N-acetylmuramyl-(pentapeptide) pyrophosphoryl-undecaprenol N-acetylglucosamine transferase